MVHLSSIQDKSDAGDKRTQEVKETHAKLAPNDSDTFSTSVYGSRFAAADLPKQEMPENEMPKEVAYRMIKDELSLDGNPMLNLASFVSTYMVKSFLGYCFQ
jgi:glutamate decarboxylase